MSDKPEDDAKLLALTERALRTSDDLLPTTEAEVERAEARLDADLELPEGLRKYHPPVQQRPDAIRAAPRRPARRFNAATHAAAAALGALAASVLFYVARPTRWVTVGGAGGELVSGTPSPSASASPRSAPIVIESACPHECCSGAECASAPPDLRSCPSGIRCAPCAPDNANGGPYRLRLGTVIPSETGRTVLPPTGSLDLCIVSSSGETSCVPASGEPGSDPLRLLKTVVTMQDLLTGLRVELRKRGEPKAIASWMHVTSPAAQVMCKGLVISFADGSRSLGQVSVFIELTHFVELARSSIVPDLLKTLERLDVRGIEPHIYETSQPGARRFALVLGPLEKREAEGLRWKALDRGLEAAVVVGEDFVGKPRTARE